MNTDRSGEGEKIKMREMREAAREKSCPRSNKKLTGKKGTPLQPATLRDWYGVVYISIETKTLKRKSKDKVEKM